VINMFLPNADYVTPRWLKKKLSRRQALKSAAGSVAIASIPSVAYSSTTENKFQSDLKQTLWATLNAVMEHLIPESETGPSAKDIQATFYLYQLVHVQPTSDDEVEFIYKGVGWLNGYTQGQLKKDFTELSVNDKELMLKAISQSTAGRNWLNMMILNIYEAMLSPPTYGGNPKGIGWQWLNHQAGFPLPKAGQRYFELPKRSRVASQQAQVISSKDLLAMNPSDKTKGFKKA